MSQSSTLCIGMDWCGDKFSIRHAEIPLSFQNHMQYTGQAWPYFPLLRHTSPSQGSDGESSMEFYALLDQVLELLRQRGRVTYRAVKRQFDLDDALLDDLKAEIIEAQRLAVDEDGNVLVWSGATASAPLPPAACLHCRRPGGAVSRPPRRAGRPSGAPCPAGRGLGQSIDVLPADGSQGHGAFG